MCQFFPPTAVRTTRLTGHWFGEKILVIWASPESQLWLWEIWPATEQFNSVQFKFLCIKFSQAPLALSRKTSRKPSSSFTANCVQRNSVRNQFWHKSEFIGTPRYGPAWSLESLKVPIKRQLASLNGARMPWINCSETYKYDGWGTAPTIQSLEGLSWPLCKLGPYPCFKDSLTWAWKPNIIFRYV